MGAAKSESPPNTERRSSPWVPIAAGAIVSAGVFFVLVAPVLSETLMPTLMPEGRPAHQPGMTIGFVIAVLVGAAWGRWWAADPRSARTGVLAALPGLGLVIIVQVFVSGGARRLLSIIGLGIALVCVCLVIGMSPVSPKQTDEKTQRASGCAAVALGGVVWLVTFFVGTPLVGTLVHRIMIGDRCVGKNVETLCGLDAVVVAILITFVLATLVMILAVGVFRRVR